MEKVVEIYIRATPGRLWEAITDPTISNKYDFGAGQVTDWQPGSHYEMSHPHGGLLGEGEIVEVDPPRRLVQTMIALWGDDVKAEGTSRVNWEIEQVGDSCRLLTTPGSLMYATPDTGTPESAHSEAVTSDVGA